MALMQSRTVARLDTSAGNPGRKFAVPPLTATFPTMKARLFAGIFAALTVLLTACGPKKEPAKPVQPNVTAAVEAAPAPTVARLPTISPAPAWQLKDVNGNTVSSDDFKGKVVVLDFWATWCPPCRAEIPGYVDLYRKYGKDGLVVVGVSLDEGGPTVVKDFVAKFGVSYPIVMGDETVQKAFGGMEGIPTTFLIDRAGQIRDRKMGAEPASEYEKKVAALLTNG
jgi:peroxiredoxin